LTGTLDVQTAKYLIEEVGINWMERRFVNYNFTRDEMRMMRDFMRDYDYLYGFGNETVV